ncbi:hypothetical protein AK830_g951 [Neonectria ditissima]|uniref:N-acetyltransferase domain-containing protein n=1 Tax=Neonectria ditissima TaxID=78410 RepID=A0A0P7BV83_9HYPO|nr:hypothetical protein AK830_g951 [Neonectria ditissima]
MALSSTILPVSSSDLHTIADFVHCAKLCLTINRLVYKDWPAEAAQKRNSTAAVESSFNDPSVECLKAVDDVSGEIVGFLALTKKPPIDEEKPASGEAGEDEQHPAEELNPTLYQAVSEATTEIFKAARGTEHYELTYICVKPSSRNRGVGSQLVQVCFDRARTAGIPLALCSEPTAHDFFVNRGINDTGHVDIDLSQWAPAYCGFGTFRLTGMSWSD